MANRWISAENMGNYKYPGLNFVRVELLSNFQTVTLISSRIYTVNMICFYGNEITSSFAFVIRIVITTAENLYKSN